MNNLKLLQGIQKPIKEEQGRVVTSVNLRRDQYEFVKKYNISMTALVKAVIDDLMKKVEG